MPTEVIMPKVDMDMERGTIATWHHGEGDKVTKDDPLFDIETDKAAMEVESPASGTLHYLAATGSEVAIGHAVAWIFAEGEEITPPPRAETAEAADPGASETGTDGDATPSSVDRPTAGRAAEAGGPDGEARATNAGATNGAAHGVPAGAVRATPAARRLAEKLGVDIAALDGSGPRGRIQKADVEAAGETRARAPAEVPSASPSRSAPPQRSALPGRAADAAAQPVVLVHGFAADAAGWAPLERQLGKGRQVARIELPGHGRTAPATIRDFAELAACVVERFDALEIADAHLVGHSLGGALSLAIADHRPHEVGALTLIAPAGLGPEIDGAALAGITRASRAESLAPWLKRLVADEDLITWNYVQAAALARADTRLREAQAAMADALFPDGVQAFDMRPALERLDCTARIIWGRKDAIIPWRHALAAPGRVSLNLFEGLGHMPHIEAPAEIARLLSS